ncbi:hypothetical protein EB796_003540 [Bugula neritina]|uniref:protein-tyrosine-phosphatase n=1 Tax=Bugula neritina TaxID=10212 RepID=A0A7J7KHL0_BUGNE|nr:hypothetical protein EB796_003540 [Bugula neritina]
MLVCIIGLVIISVVIFKRHKSQQRRRFMRPSIHHDDNYSLSSLSVTTGEFSTAKRHGNKSFRSTLKTNPGFTTDELSYTNTMTLSKLSTRSLEMDYLEEELKSIPSNMPKMCSLPEGAQAKNRYANVIPLESSRVILTSKPRTGNSQYINANYIKGYNGSPKAYIATQAPLQHTVVDFWTMVWENQSQVIVMLMNWVEDNQ